MRILIADDTSVARRVLQQLLITWGYQVEVVEDGEAAWKCLNAPDPPRIALLDWMMPGQNGVDVCRNVRKLRPSPYTYILLITARNEKESIVEGLEAGADDYLTKPFNPQELKARLRVGLRLLELEDNLMQASEIMKFKAMHDTLTGIWNRGAILDALEREFARSQREGASLGVLMIDIDHSKAVNDTFGHVVGDSVLAEVTQRIQKSLRSYDAIGRYGGEEFLVVLSNCGELETVEKAEQLLATIRQTPIETGTGLINITVSIGGMATTNETSPSTKTILQAADASLYRAKESGRDRVVMTNTAIFREKPKVPVVSI